MSGVECLDGQGGKLRRTHDSIGTERDRLVETARSLIAKRIKRNDGSSRSGANW
ncbi:hypothetical protein GGTG_11908 [Gaeumannomyces tritici R3-111a-1]|uniref:Uncharacterized protein n=1 Tax=Gaeumannomyces tritici (strain R3-111a-1) TaxID=644352 RepID=J3PEH7_GAET3|nr:hypothetical protein GGTG_11908 [Gaeumannomyces tritici R3-111a-1]EJT70885.1 hypothetical protein GGTG_11908 [Gaeumannomyces tritici R3-111a-1]